MRAMKVSKRKKISRETDSFDLREGFSGQQTSPGSRSLGRRFFVGLSWFFLVILISALCVGLVFIRTMPLRYDLNMGQVSDYDIFAPYAAIDQAGTQHEAEIRAAMVKDVMRRSDKLSGQFLRRTRHFLSIVEYERDGLRTLMNKDSEEANRGWLPNEQQLNSAIAALQPTLLRELNINLSVEVAGKYLAIDPGTYDYISGRILNIAESLMEEPRDAALLSDGIEAALRVFDTQTGLFSKDLKVAASVLPQLLGPNVEFDELATESLREQARQEVLSAPLMIEKGDKIVNIGDRITQEQYELLKKYNLLTTNSIDWRYLLTLSAWFLIILILAVFYLRSRREIWADWRRKMIIITALLIPFLIALWIAPLLPLVIPVFFAAIIIAIYCDFTSSIVLTTLLNLFFLTLTGLDTKVLFVGVIGSICAALVSAGITKRDNFALMIFVTSMGPGVAAGIFSYFAKESLPQVATSMGIAALSGGLSAVAAIGFNPLYQIAFNALSPIRLIELSHPSQPLLKRLFIEAPGTSQHSVMAANLAEAAADAINADALLARVGAFYHDIGKLENPDMFTENQLGSNPHDGLSPEESVTIIIKHVADGIRLARRNRIPDAIQDFIVTHHGNMVQTYFYNKARKIAGEAGLPEPSMETFRYPGHKPHTRETGIVMLADSVEAAMKATGIRDLKRAEQLIRQIIKDKNDQDQLIDSGLSYQEVEVIIRAMLQVYAGQFHERIRYPQNDAIAARKR